MDNFTPARALRAGCGRLPARPHETGRDARIRRYMSTAYSSLPLAEPLQRAVADMGYEQMTPIQAQAIPVVLAGQDVMGAAQTGTGKTAAFSLPLLQRLLKHETASLSPARHPVRALVLLPTRELAVQVAQQVRQYAKYTQLRSAVVFGGMDMKPQIEELRKGVEVLVATPGRLLDHIEAKTAVLGQVEYVVLDEADRMLDIGFLPDLQRILGHLPKNRTTLLFSATFSPEIKRLAESYLHQPVLIEVARPNETAATVEQLFFSVEGEGKRRAIGQMLKERGLRQAFVFTNSKLGCARLARALERDGLRCAALHGDKSQDERLKALEAFKAGEVDLLVCTDVAARGLDIKDVPAVFNHDLPFNPEDYVHRIGRTGRAGASGLAISFVTESDKRLVAELEKLLKKKVQLQPWEDAWRAPRDSHPARDSREARNSPRRSEDRRSPREARAYAPRPLPGQPQDPFFDRPYEAAAEQEPPAWEKTTRSAPQRTGRAGLSANIKPRRQVAALLSARPAATEPLTPPAANAATEAGNDAAAPSHE